MMKMNTKNLGTLILLAVFVLVFVSAGSAMAAEATSSDKFATSLEQSLKHYVMALEAYNSGDYGKANGQLQAAASNAKNVDPELANLLTQARTELVKVGRIEFKTAIPIGTIYNNLFGKPLFDLGNPLGIPPGEGTTGIPPGEGQT